MADLHFAVGSNVKIDNRGKATILRMKSSTAGEIYSVLIDGIDFEVDLPRERLSLVSDSDHDKKQTTQFQQVSDEDVSSLILQQKNKNTLSKTYCNLKLIRDFMSGENETREIQEIQEIPPDQLCPILCKFFVGVRKPDRSNSEPVTLRGFLGSFERHLRNKSYSYSLIHGIEFVRVKEVLQAKSKELKSQGLGNQPVKAEAISDSEIDQLWSSNQLGNSSPESIINRLWLFNTISFGLRGAEICVGGGTFNYCQTNQVMNF